MEQDVFKLSEVVVTGQATQVERRSATTAIAYVSGEDVSKVASPTIENALTGKVAGVNLQSNSGAPGGGIQMQIRGNTTILGASDPLYVIDGVIYSNVRVPSRRFNADGRRQPERGRRGQSRRRHQPGRHPEHRDPEGRRGVLDLRRQGVERRRGHQHPARPAGPGARERVTALRDLRHDQGLRGEVLGARRSRRRASARPANDYATNGELPCINHYDQVFGNNPLSYETVADVSGGNESTRYFISGTWKKDGGIENNTGFGRQAVRVNLDQIISPKFDVKVSTAFNRSSHQRGWTNNSNNFASAGYALAYTPSYIDLRPDANGKLPQAGR